MAISQYGNEYYGLSGDDKPLGTPLNGRKFTEMDTSKEYRYDAENQQWLQQSGGGGSTTLSGLTDVDISNPTDGQTLVYNAESGKWVNGAGGSGVLIVTEVPTDNPKILRLDHTYREIVNADMAIWKPSEEGVTLLAYLGDYQDLPTAANSGAKADGGWLGILTFVNISSTIDGSALQYFSFNADDPDDYPVLYHS